MDRYRKANEDIHAPETVKRGAAAPKEAPRRSRWVGVTAAALALVALGGLLLWPGSPLTPAARAAIVQAQYPELPPYPSGSDWSEKYEKQSEAWHSALRTQKEALRTLRPDGDGLAEFYADTMGQFLSGGGTENRVYSPLNVYMALAMLAEVTDGDSRGQILNLLGVDGVEELRALSSALWNANYRADSTTTSILASSLWLDEGLTYDRTTLDRLAEVYYASSFAGKMGSAEFTKVLQSWLNQQTGGLLKEAAQGVELTPKTVLALASTLYYKVRWTDEFQKGNNVTDVFHGPEGDVTAVYMRQTDVGTYYYGEKFSAIRRTFKVGGAMWLILPDEGYTPEDLLKDPEALSFLSNAAVRSDWEGNKRLIIHQSIPKFDVSASADLAEGLKALGVTDVFDAQRADFTPALPGAEGVAVSQVSHAARVTIDEEGCTAAAFTVLPMAGAVPPPDEEVDFTLDRPFLFLVESESGQPLFTGVVNQP